MKRTFRSEETGAANQHWFMVNNQESEVKKPLTSIRPPPKMSSQTTSERGKMWRDKSDLEHGLWDAKETPYTLWPDSSCRWTRGHHATNTVCNSKGLKSTTVPE